MTEPYSTGSTGERLLAQYLAASGRVVRPSDTKTFDLVVDGSYAEVKASDGPYSALGFIGLTDNQFKALKAGVQFNLFIVCNVAHPDNLEVIEIPSSRLRTESPRVECTYYWYRSQLDKLRDPGDGA
jgi:hypothetical protein